MSLSHSDRLRVLITGVFDIENYGDLLFPIVASHRLSPFGVEVVPVAPSSKSSVLPDALPPIDMRTMIGGQVPFDAVLLGGGYMINVHPMDFLEEYTSEGVAAWAMAGLWLGGTLAGSLYDAPVLWNAPGVPHPFGRRIRPLVEAAARAATYLALRDRGGVRLLAAPKDVEVSVVPDTIAELSRVWPRETLLDLWNDFLQRKGADRNARYLALHVRNRSISGSSIAEVAARVSDVATQHRLVPLLVAVGRTHQDPTTARALATALEQRCVLLDDPASLREISAVFAHASLYMGSSLHGYIASSSYGTPGVLVGRPAYQKFGGFLEQTGRMCDLARSWEEAVAIAGERAREERSPRIPSSAFASLDAHWSRIRAGIRDGDARVAQRAAFLKTLVRDGVRGQGADWLMQTVLDLSPRYRKESVGAT